MASGSRSRRQSESSGKRGPRHAYFWMGAGTVALGVGAALAGGSGVAHADSTSSGTSSSSSSAHHQAHSSAASSTQRRVSSASAKAVQPKSRASDVATATAASPDHAALVAQGTEIAEQGTGIDKEEKAFATQVGDVVKTINFSNLPTELNATRIYSGAGSAALLDASQSWNQLAANLNTSAQNFDTAASTLAAQPWLAPASTAITAAAQPYVAWLAASASQAELAAAQAKSAASAFETAFGANVSPTVIAANRATLVALTATNLFGFNPPAIAETGILYAGLWAQSLGPQPS